MPTPTFNLAPSPLWALHDQAGHALVDGYMYTYDASNKGNYQPVFQDITGNFPYSQPVRFGAGGFAGPFYWQSNVNYYLRIFDATGQLVRDFDNYNAPGEGGSSPTSSYIDINNLIGDSQFNYPLVSSRIASGGIHTLTATGWQHVADGFGNHITDNFTAFILGINPPSNTPVNMINVVNISAGTSATVNDLYWTLPKVESLNNRTVSFAFDGIDNGTNPNISILFKQNFGSGGSGESSDSFSAVTNFSLTNTWARYTGSITIPSTSGKTIGTDNNDYLAMIFRFPLNSLFNQSITNIQLNDNVLFLPYDYKTVNQSIEFPYFNSQTARNKYLGIDANGLIAWL